MKIFLLVFINLFIPAYIWNHDIFLWINGLNSPIADNILGLIGGFGDGLVVTLLLAMLMLFHLRLGLAALMATALSGLFAQILKRLFDMPRPPAVFENIHILGQSLTSHSFPSGHATSCGVMALVALLLWKYDKRLAWVVSSLFVIAAYSRMYVGVHFPLDVVVGFGLGVGCMHYSHQISKAWNVEAWLLSSWSWKLPGLLLLIAAVLLGTGYQVQPNTAQPLALLLPITALFTLMFAWKKKLL